MHLTRAAALRLAEEMGKGANETDEEGEDSIPWSEMQVGSGLGLHFMACGFGLEGIGFQCVACSVWCLVPRGLKANTTVTIFFHGFKRQRMTVVHLEIEAWICPTQPPGRPPKPKR